MSCNAELDALKTARDRESHSAKIMKGLLTEAIKLANAGDIPGFMRAFSQYLQAQSDWLASTEAVNAAKNNVFRCMIRELAVYI